MYQLKCCVVLHHMCLMKCLHPPLSSLNWLFKHRLLYQSYIFNLLLSLVLFSIWTCMSDMERLRFFLTLFVAVKNSNQQMGELKTGRGRQSEVHKLIWIISFNNYKGSCCSSNYISPKWVVIMDKRFGRWNYWYFHVLLLLVSSFSDIYVTY